jgi:hypothetical protein
MQRKIDEKCPKAAKERGRDRERAEKPQVERSNCPTYQNEMGIAHSGLKLPSTAVPKRRRDRDRHGGCRRLSETVQLFEPDKIKAERQGNSRPEMCRSFDQS